MEFSAEAVRRHLPAGHKPPVYYYEELGSTNTEARRLAREGAPHGTAVLAERQTAGRGRLGRSFFSPGGAGV
ncbi:biotin--[acetyl-CoA-carboxylase] ligase, partial [Anaerotruncus massiliensis (ex Liu et al. 2021)]